ncbi:uncharacterized protein LOC135145204 isoform X2 [Zophobas morio]|uniref:uncharacterized protein LOC135145204 isoform X2 n=1 Tax=Zophobas morio TaxID=2755281 RepID=UPI003082B198
MLITRNFEKALMGLLYQSLVKQSSKLFSRPLNFFSTNAGKKEEEEEFKLDSAKPYVQFLMKQQKSRRPGLPKMFESSEVCLLAESVWENYLKKNLQENLKLRKIRYEKRLKALKALKIIDRTLWLPISPLSP